MWYVYPGGSIAYSSNPERPPNGRNYLKKFKTSKEAEAWWEKQQQR
jgi:hypothetical protein